MDGMTFLFLLQILNHPKKATPEFLGLYMNSMMCSDRGRWNWQKSNPFVSFKIYTILLVECRVRGLAPTLYPFLPVRDGFLLSNYTLLHIITANLWGELNSEIWLKITQSLSVMLLYTLCLFSVWLSSSSLHPAHYFTYRYLSSGLPGF